MDVANQLGEFVVSRYLIPVECSSHSPRLLQTRPDNLAEQESYNRINTLIVTSEMFVTDYRDKATRV